MLSTPPKTSGDVHEQFVENVIQLTHTTSKLLNKRTPIQRLKKAVFCRSRPITSPNQIVTPTITWDWPPAPAGTEDFEQYQLSDLIPQTIESGDEYAPSSDSFSTNYRAFLDFIDAEKFPAKGLLADAKVMMKKPTTSPANSQAKDGWTKVMKAGVNRWAPIWSVSDSADSWTSKVKAGVISNPGSFTLNLKKTDHSLIQVSSGNDNLTDIVADKRAIKQVTISAKAWGQITISPGAWYDSSLVKLGKPYLRDQDAFFGPKGLLRGRISSFLVAYQPQFEFDGANKAQESLVSKLSNEPGLHALGIPVKLEAPSPDSASNQTVTLENTSQTPVIVAVIIDS